MRKRFQHLARLMFWRGKICPRRVSQLLLSFLSFGVWQWHPWMLRYLRLHRSRVANPNLLICYLGQKHFITDSHPVEFCSLSFCLWRWLLKVSNGRCLRSVWSLSLALPRASIPLKVGVLCAIKFGHRWLLWLRIRLFSWWHALPYNLLNF